MDRDRPSRTAPPSTVLAEYDIVCKAHALGDDFTHALYDYF